jgi:thioredoxin 1
MLIVELVFTPGCTQCERTRAALKSVVASFGEGRAAWREVNVIDEMDRAVELGVLAPPAIAINGELVFPQLPSERVLREALEQRLSSKGA